MELIRWLPYIMPPWLSVVVMALTASGLFFLFALLISWSLNPKDAFKFSTVLALCVFVIVGAALAAAFFAG